MADGKFADAQVPNSGTHQLQHLAPDGFEHPPHLPIASFVNGDFDERVLRGIADSLY
jgi:hypothetical protein